MTSEVQKYDEAYRTCQVCGSDRIRLIHEDFRENRIFSCEQCSVQFMNPVYTDEYLQAYYAGYYGGGVAHPSIVKAQEKDNEIKFHFIDKFISASGTALDFGCGNGNFSAYAKNRGWDVTGYDVDCEAMSEVAARHGIRVESGSLALVDWKGSKFDLIHAHHVVEHLKNPVQALKLLNNLLTDRGFLYVAVPNINSFSARAKFLLEKVGVRRKNIGKYYDSEHHVFYYSPESLQALLEKCGFEALLSMNAVKSTVGRSKITEFLACDLPNRLYSNGAFFTIARKKLPC